MPMRLHPRQTCPGPFPRKSGLILITICYDCPINTNKMPMRLYPRQTRLSPLPRKGGLILITICSDCPTNPNKMSMRLKLRQTCLSPFSRWADIDRSRLRLPNLGKNGNESSETRLQSRFLSFRFHQARVSCPGDGLTICPETDAVRLLPSYTLDSSSKKCLTLSILYDKERKLRMTTYFIHHNESESNKRNQLAGHQFQCLMSRVRESILPVLTKINTIGLSHKPKQEDVYASETTPDLPESSPKGKWADIDRYLLRLPDIRKNGEESRELQLASK